MSKPDQDQYKKLEAHISKLYPTDMLLCYQEASVYLNGRETTDLDTPLGEALWQGIYAYLDVIGEVVKVCSPRATPRAMSLLVRRAYPKAARVMESRLANIARLVDDLSAVRANELEAQSRELQKRVAELESQLAARPVPLEVLSMEEMDTVHCADLITACSLMAFARQHSYGATRAGLVVTAPVAAVQHWRDAVANTLEHLRSLPAVQAARTQHLAFKARQAA